MATWSGMKKKLETEYLAESLRGHISYFATFYRQTHDARGSRASILYDGKEILKGNYFAFYLKADQLEDDELKKRRLDQCWDAPQLVDERVLELGIFDNYNFYEAFEELDNQSIEDSLQSENLLVRIFAILDRRVGKRRLRAMREQMEREGAILRQFYALRLQAEGMSTQAAEELEKLL